MSPDFPHVWSPSPNGRCRYCGQLQSVCPGIGKPSPTPLPKDAQQRTVFEAD